MLRKRSNFPGFVDEFFGKDLLSPFFEFERGISSPAVNIVEGKDDYRIEVAAPGLEKKDFKINLDNKVLTISSEKEEKNEESGDHFMRREFNYRSFSRSFVLPDGADGEKVSASYKEGVLDVTIPKREEAKVKPAKEIKIS
jgi:HSP20 family protein